MSYELSSIKIKWRENRKGRTIMTSICWDLNFTWNHYCSSESFKLQSNIINFSFQKHKITRDLILVASSQKRLHKKFFSKINFKLNRIRIAKMIFITLERLLNNALGILQKFNKFLTHLRKSFPGASHYLQTFTYKIFFN